MPCLAILRKPPDRSLHTALQKRYRFIILTNTCCIINVISTAKFSSWYYSVNTSCNVATKSVIHVISSCDIHLFFYRAIVQNNNCRFLINILLRNAREELPADHFSSGLLPTSLKLSATVLYFQVIYYFSSVFFCARQHIC